jgi:hypothetical protein
MQRCLARLILPALVLASLVSLGSRPASAEEVSTPAHPVWLASFTQTCTVWIATDYFTDAGETNRVGQCSLTCWDATHGNASATFAGGGTCTGVSGPYTLRRIYACPGICP